MYNPWRLHISSHFEGVIHEGVIHESILKTLFSLENTFQLCRSLPGIPSFAKDFQVPYEPFQSPWVIYLAVPSDSSVMWVHEFRSSRRNSTNVWIQNRWICSPESMVSEKIFIGTVFFERGAKGFSIPCVLKFGDFTVKINV